MKWHQIILSIFIVSCFSFGISGNALLKSQAYQFSELEYELMVASISGDTAKIRRLLQLGADINVSTEQGITPLLYAVSYQRSNAVDLLLELNADPDIGTLNGENPLLESIKLQNLTIAEKLIRAGADINHTDINGATSLHYAALFGYFYEADMLLYYEALPDQPANDGTTPLMAAVISGSFDIADILLQAGVNVNSVDRTGYTPFLIAAQNGDTLMMELLLKFGASLYDVSNEGYNAIAIAIRENFPDMFNYLLEKGNLWHLEDRSKINPWLIAEAYQRRNFVPLLRKEGIKKESSGLIDQATIEASFMATRHQSFAGMSLRVKRPLFGTGLIIGLDMKPWDSRVLIEETDWISQYTDRRSVAYIGVFRDFRLTSRPSKTIWHLSVSAKAGYKFGNRYPGTNLKPEHGFTFIPAATVIAERSGFITTIGVEYMNSEVYKSGSVWFRIGFGYNFFFNDIRSQGKTIIWK